MPLANIILSKIAESGLEVRVEEGMSGESRVRAIDGGTGRVWEARGPTLIDAAEDLLGRLDGHSEGYSHVGAVESAVEAGGGVRLARGVDSLGLVAIINMMGVIFILDLATPGINLGILYLVPLWLAYHWGITTRRIASMAVVMVVLIFVDHAMIDGPFQEFFREEPAGLLNRCFAVLAIAGSVVVMRLLLMRRSIMVAERMGPEEGAGHGPKAELRPWAVWLAGILIVGTFIGDLMTQVSADVPMFYLVPIAMIASTYQRPKMWGVGVILLGLIVLAYVMSPRDGLMAADAPLVIMNRIATCIGLAFVAFICQRGRRRVVEMRNVTAVLEG